MSTTRRYRAEFNSPGRSAGERGIIEYESDARANTKANFHAARMALLARYGSKAVSWQLHNFELVREPDEDDPIDGQSQLDFRDAPKKRRVRRTVQRGRI